MTQQNTSIIDRGEIQSLRELLQGSLIRGRQAPECESYVKRFNDGVGRAIHHIKVLLEEVE